MFRRLLLVAVLVLSVSGVVKSDDASKTAEHLRNIKVGQWVSYKITGITGNEITQKQSVIDIKDSDEDKINTMNVEIDVGGEKQPDVQQQVALNAALKTWNDGLKKTEGVTITDTTVVVNGKEYDAVLVDADVDGIHSKIWMSDMVPVTGILKMELEAMSGGLVMELIDFGA